jgi:hypothetical protein
MKKMIIALLMFSSVSFASDVKTINFTYFGNSGMNRQFYACSYVEDQTVATLETFGATGIEVYCSGGIQPYSVGPVSVRAKFDLPVVSGNSVEDVRLEGDTWNPNCGINTKIISEAIKVFKNITVVKKSDSCPFTNSNYSYVLKIAR